MNEISEKYKKYLVEVKVNGEKKLFVSGMNISKNGEDFLLIDGRDKILIFNDFHQIEEFIRDEKNLLDRDVFYRWVQELENHKPYICYDVDNIVQIIKASEGIKELNMSESSHVVDLINIIGDYAYQINSKDLILLFENKVVDLFKELFMDRYIWGEIDSGQESDIRKIYGNFPYEEFKVVFVRLINFFTEQLSNYSNLKID